MVKESLIDPDVYIAGHYFFISQWPPVMHFIDWNRKTPIPLHFKDRLPISLLLLSKIKRIN